MHSYLRRLQRGADKTVLHLQLARLLRSISQGIAIVDLALYLKDLHWSAKEIGGVLSAAGVAGAVLILFVGVLSDRYGRKRFLLVYELLTAISALLMVFTESSPLIAVIIVLTGFGRGQNGAAGPFTPAEQAWMTAHVARQYRGRVFSTNNALGFFGMAIGSILAALPRLWWHSLPGASAYKPLFGLMFVGSVLCAIVIATAPKEQRTQRTQRVDETNPATEDAVTPQAPDERSIRRQENRNMLRLAGVNLLNGLAVGFVGPMMSYWFASKFGVSSAQIGITLALSFVFTGISSLVTGALTTRFGLIRSVVLLQVLGTVMILILPLMPSFALASTFYVLRSALSRGTQGARSALSTSLTRDKRRGFSVSMNSLVMRTSSAIGPTLSGYLLDAGAFSVPFYITGVLQMCSALLYGRLFRSFDAPQRGNLRGHDVG
ncbi:MFS transporter [Alicyclobacillus fastidiosus]|uniref:MFS transporter n=1 Tax=Alicyclobacillus fastidiosus TaxID=392011 RepID=A0ABY6ZM45_9BACL|nr:MFS transporter [Alicyclobacillus fastidiosus]WAH43921.1 MFS transporter [Alicyclobacillus fastidiosus]GMA60164.1 tetracycline resistance MFS efflux pump [Alicyclobacillus fastidiosus]